MAEERVRPEREGGSHIGTSSIPIETKREEENGKKKKRQAPEKRLVEESMIREAEEMIEAAMHSAAELQGRQAAASQTEWLSKVQVAVAGQLRALTPGFKVGDLGEMLSNVIDILEKADVFCRSRSTFPLPTHGIVDSTLPKQAFLQCVAKGLNSLYGLKAPDDFEGSSTSLRALKRISSILDENPLLNEPLPDTDFGDFFRSKGIDYHGEEVKVARKVTWEGIEASLPAEVASLDIRRFCTGGVLEYINNFTNYLVDPCDQFLGKTPRVMVDDEEWPRVAEGLVRRGLCLVLREPELYHVGSAPLKNGLFAVSKQEFKGNVEICRLIMNLKPLNSLCLPLEGDTPTLPSVTSMSGLYLQEDELLMLSSEDIKCFFYLFQVPRAWIPFLGFAKECPSSLLPEDFLGEKGFLCAQVLPMGFLNSVGIAQHIHRRIILQSVGSYPHGLGGESEVRRDRVQSSSNHLFRIYLDNFDELRKVQKDVAMAIEGNASSLVEEVRVEYEAAGLPRHPKKALMQGLRGEIQGAWLDGVKGTAMAKPSKAVKYIRLALEVIKEGRASLKELQVVCGGLVYLSMYKRPALCSLNHVWRTIVLLDKKPKGVRTVLKREVLLELVRFVCITPLLFMNFRAPFDSAVTASDASTSGGGVCVSQGLTAYGDLAQQGLVRGDRLEPAEQISVLSIGLFDGISALRVALDSLNAPVCGHISVEMQAEARRVVEAFFPDTLFVTDVAEVDEAMVQSWALRFSSVGLIILGSGPPCQGVSGLNADRRGALRDHRSSLFHHVSRVKRLLVRFFPWAQVQSLTENVSSMDRQDCEHMNSSFEDQPWFADALGLTLARRPRLYWVSWELEEEDGAALVGVVERRLPVKGQVLFNHTVDEKDFLEPGWRRAEGEQLPTFTTARPSPRPMRKPAGLHLCQEHELHRWRLDSHKFPPYQYRDIHCVHHRSGEARPPSVLEREVILGFPSQYTAQCLPKKFHMNKDHEDCRLTLLGNSWSVPVVAWFIKVLLVRLGLIPRMTLEEMMDRFTPGRHPSLQGLLLRPPLKRNTPSFEGSSELCQKLFGLTSLKGEDLMIQGDSEAPLKFHRLRQGVPSKMWRWRTVAGWSWKQQGEHINALEMRAVLTSIRWRVEQLKQQDLRVVHLVDSLVVLHSMSRGRSSSRKPMRTVMRINSFLLASGLQVLWSYVDTKSNPADKPSRWGTKAPKRKWVRRKTK